MMEEYLVLVDRRDNPVGTGEKVRCHLPDGRLHRAFTALLFDESGRLALARRSRSKMLWPGFWDGTVASHPRESETYTESAERRMPEEVGIGCRMDYLFKFEYHVPYGDVGSENEICATLLGTVGRDQEFKLVKDEISEMKWMAPAELIGDLAADPGAYCPWMIVALYLLPESGGMLQRHGRLAGMWTRPEFKKPLRDAIGAHMPDDKWGLVS